MLYTCCCCAIVPFEHFLPVDQPAGCREKEERSLVGAEELFGTTSESDTSTFHGFEDDDLEELPSNGHGLSSRHR